MTRKGIDVSHWQGTIDWNKVKKAGIEFAIIKAGGSDAGFYTDSKWEANYKGAKAAGIPIGAYYFVGKDCVTAAAGKADAERFLQILKGKQLEYPVYMDNEAQPASAKAGITEATIAFCETMENAGYFVGIYGSAVSGGTAFLEFLRNITHLKMGREEEIYIRSRFDKIEGSCRVRITLSLCLWQAVHILLPALMKYLLLQQKKEQQVEKETLKQKANIAEK